MNAKFVRMEHMPEDDYEYFVNDVSVVRVNHDEHGYSGMDAIDNAFDRIAAALGVEVEERCAE